MEFPVVALSLKILIIIIIIIIKKAAGLTVLRNLNIVINKVSLYLFICLMLLWLTYIVVDFF